MIGWRTYGVALTLLVLLASMLAIPRSVLGADISLDPQTAAAPIADRWSRADGPIAQGRTTRSWLWGPAIRAIAHEPYLQAPNGSRAVVYFDKARLEITHPDGDAQSLWYVSAGALVREMLTGQVQIGDNSFLDIGPAAIPVAGDIEQNPQAPTYAALGRVASVGDGADARRAAPALGQPVTAHLQADGTVAAKGDPDGGVTITVYDEQGGHNLPGVFVDLLNAQPYPREYVAGLALTEPYWIEAMVAGQPKHVLVQAFERRILTYTPDNPPGLQVEFGNAGLDYRRWRSLEVPNDPMYQLLASGVPWGEIITRAAKAKQVDPFLFAALAQVASGYAPLAQMPTGGQGFFGLRPELAGSAGNANQQNPAAAADTAADTLARLRGVSEDWRGALALYYTGGANPDWSDPGLNAFVKNVLDTEAVLIDDYTKPPQLLAVEGPLLGAGHAAYYSPNYSVAWWEGTMQRYAGWGNITPGWSVDPNGYYCVKPGFQVGQRLQLSANGVTIWCTIGDTVATWDQPLWLSRWVVELSYNTFTALGLGGNNWVEVRAP